MRASATSRIASPATIHASQARAHASKTDEASPFALLVESAAPKEAAKPSRKDAHESGDSQADNKQADDKIADRPDNKADAAQPSAPQSRSAQNNKTDTAGKDEDKAAKPDAADVSQLALLEPQQLAMPVPPPAPQTAAIAAPADGEAEEIQTDTAAASQASASQASASQASASQTSAAQPAASQPSPLQASALQPSVPQPVTPKAQAPFAPQAEDSQAKDAEVQTPAGLIAQSTAKADAKPTAPKTDTAKPTKTAAADKIVPADSAKPDTAKTETDKSAEFKPDAPQAAASSEAPKPAPPPVQAASDPVPATAITASQAPAPTAAPAIAQHVQVTAQPGPNLPALAVTIAAKSQGGARQFDIRLDPPELGRVDVRLSIDAAGKTSAHLTADHVQTLDLLQKDSTSLTRALREAGLDVSQDGLNFSLRQQAHDGGASQGGHRGAARTFSLSATTSIEATASSAAYRAPADGRLDIRV